MRTVAMRWKIGVALIVGTLAAVAALRPVESKSSIDEPIASHDARAQAKQFSAYYRGIPLTPEQAGIKKRALRSIPAPCCKDYSIATCCCPCNLAKSLWGLTHPGCRRA